MYLANAVSTGPATDLEGCSFLDLSCRRREPSERQKKANARYGFAIFFYFALLNYHFFKFLRLRYFQTLSALIFTD